MNIKIRATNFELTPAIEEYVTKKISMLEKFLEVKDATLCEVEIGRTTNHHRSGDVFRAEINLTQPGHGQVYAVDEEEDLYAAIDIVRDEAEMEITREKKKRWHLLRRGGVKAKAILKRLDIRPKRWK